MSTAKREGGLYYVNGQAVDSEGRKVEGAPDQSPDTDPSKQPGAIGAAASDPIQRLADTLAAALAGKGASPARTGAPDGTGNGANDDDVALPTLAELPDHLAGLTTVEEVTALQKLDKRKGATSLYDARLSELEAE
jgi:hypothetical protein